MAKRQSSAPDPEAMQRVYYDSRFPALALALALSADEGEAYRSSLHAHTAVFGGRQKAIGKSTILKKVFLKTKSIAEVGQEISGQLMTLGKKTRAAWALVRVSGIPPEEASQILGEPAQPLAAQADTVLNVDFTNGFKARVSHLMEKKELWNDVLFRTGKKRALSTRLSRVAAVVAAAGALFLIGREGYALTRALGGRADNGSVVTMRAADPAFFRRVPERPSTELPNVNQPLMDALENVNENQSVRVSFRFYDARVMRETRPQGSTLEDIYTKLYEETLARGRVNALTAAAANEYYANYTRPFLVEQRAGDFLSEHGSMYEAMLSIANAGVYARTRQEHPEVFASREAFDAYLYSLAFVSRAPALIPLLRLQRGIESGDESLRNEYEDALFAFHNPGGYAGVETTVPFPFEADDLRAFYAQREILGKALHQRNAEACNPALPENADVTNDLLEGTDFSLFSATLTKADVMRLAADERFFFLGLTAPRAALFEGRAEAELLALAREGLAKRHDVYLIDENYLLYSINYAAPLTLPQGFIDDIRAKLGAEDTQFEMEVGYVCRMRYAHPQARTGYGILRALALNGDIAFTTRESKPFSLMAGY